MNIWTKEQARNYLLNYHFIHSKKSPSINDVFNRLHSIQYDPLYVVGFQHDLMLQARVPNYKIGDLYQKMYTDKQYIDHWDRIASIIDVNDYPKLAPIREKMAEDIKHDVKKYFNDDVSSHEDDILNTIKDSIVSTKDLKAGEKVNSKWWSSRQSGFTIDYLLHKGKIAIDHRVHSNRYLGLFDKIYPNLPKDVAYHSFDDFLLYYLKRRVETVGITWNKSHNQLATPFLKTMKEREKYFHRLVEDKAIEAFKIEGVNETFYCPKKSITLNEIDHKVSFIAPLDNLIWDRALVKTLFEFDYKWEVYVPKAKRTYGFYVLPILYKDQFIGRIEFNKQKNHNPLHIISVYYEDDIKLTKQLKTKFNQALIRFQKYLNADSIIFD